jgi:hypothetical protein
VGEILLDLGHLTTTQCERVISTMVELGYSDYRTGLTPPDGEPLLRGFAAPGVAEIK